MCETAFRLLENRRFSFFIVFGFMRVPLDFKSGTRLFFRCSGGRHENGVRGGPLLRNIGGRFSNSGFVSASTAAQARTAQHALPRLSESVLKPLHVLISSRHIKSPLMQLLFPHQRGSSVTVRSPEPVHAAQGSFRLCSRPGPPDGRGPVPYRRPNGPC